MKEILPISRPYCLISNLPTYLDHEGKRFVDAMWAKDLLEHVKYIQDLTLVSPMPGAPPVGAMICVQDIQELCSLKFVDLAPSDNTFKFFTTLPRNLPRVYKAIIRNAIVHTVIAGWPIPWGWFAIPLARLNKRFIVVVVESAFWRLTPGAPASWKAQIRAFLSERLNRWCMRNVDLPVFTQQQYRDSLLPKSSQNHTKGLVINASWVDSENVLSPAKNAELWRNKRDSEPLRCIFAGRLLREKGVGVLLKTLKDLSKGSCKVHVSLIGEGKLLPDCKHAATEMKGDVQLTVLPPVPYGPDFFTLLQSQHLVLVPSISDEQPRIVYDAYSQGVPVIGTNTPGLAACVEHDKTGILLPPGDAEALAATLCRLNKNRKPLQTWGEHGRLRAAELTHEVMHLQRLELLRKALRDYDAKEEE